MCSTPRCSAKPHSTHRLSESAADYKSYSHMMRNASQRYEQLQEELAKQRAERAQRENVEDQTGSRMTFELINEDQASEVKEPEVGFFMSIILKLFSFFERKSTPIYHEYR